MMVRIVAFEGIDRSGKSTLRKLFSQRTGERYVTLSRFLLSNAAYDVIFGRTTGPGIEEYLLAMRDMENRHGLLTVLVDTLPETCAERQEPYNYTVKYTVEKLHHHRRVFLALCGPSEGPRLILETDNRSVLALSQEVEGWVASR